MSIKETMDLRFELDRAKINAAELRERNHILAADNQRLSEELVKLTADVERAGECVVAVTALVKVVSRLASKVLENEV